MGHDHAPQSRHAQIPPSVGGKKIKHQLEKERKKEQERKKEKERKKERKKERNKKKRAGQKGKKAWEGRGIFFSFFFFFLFFFYLCWPIDSSVFFFLFLLLCRYPPPNGQTEYLDGAIFLPVWGGRTTTEARLVVTEPVGDTAARTCKQIQ
jgi:hypothetical protein